MELLLSAYSPSRSTSCTSLLPTRCRAAPVARLCYLRAVTQHQLNVSVAHGRRVADVGDGQLEAEVAAAHHAVREHCLDDGRKLASLMTSADYHLGITRC